MDSDNAIDAFSLKPIGGEELSADGYVALELFYDPASVLPADFRWGSSVLPADMNDEKEDVYADFCEGAIR